jgi:hypothetical protein
MAWSPDGLPKDGAQGGKSGSKGEFHKGIGKSTIFLLPGTPRFTAAPPNSRDGIAFVTACGLPATQESCYRKGAYLQACSLALCRMRPWRSPKPGHP